MKRAFPLCLAVAAAACFVGGATAAGAQTGRSPECVRANDEVTKHRTGKDRAGRAHSVSAEQAVAVGRRFATRCDGDSGFLLAFALARIDLAKDVRRVSLSERGELFRDGVADLERVKQRASRGQSDRYEVFNILALIYYDTKQYEKSLAVLLESAPHFERLTTTSRRNTFFTRGMAQYQLGRYDDAARSFAYARKFGHPGAATWEAAMRKMLAPAKR